MPELPEVETLARQFRKQIQGAVLSKISVIHPVVIKNTERQLAQNLENKKLKIVKRRGKYLGFEFENEATLWVHLGMTGQLVWRKTESPLDQHTHLSCTFKDLSDRLIFRDIRKFGKVFLAIPNEVLPKGFSALGTEPFKLEKPDFIRIFRERQGKIKALLLNQTLLAGIGNIYADECLHRAGIDPRKRGRKVTKEQYGSLCQSVYDVLAKAIENGGSSIDDYIDTYGAKGSFQKYHLVYAREGKPCFKCGMAIRRVIISGRSTFFCSNCQT